MRERVYYRIVVELMSALSIGAADSTKTDNDVVLDSRGLPLLPATSLAGVYRSFFDTKQAQSIFGDISNTNAGDGGSDRAQVQVESAVRVYDGEWIGGNSTIAVRDSVSLKGKVAIDKLKFDREAVQAGARFVTYIEIVDLNRCSCTDIESAIKALHSGELCLGSKTTRGFGRLEVVRCQRRGFGERDVDEWLDFDLFSAQDSPSWSVADDITKSIRSDATFNGVELRLSLELRGGISIREYTTEPGDGVNPYQDYGQMIVHGISDDSALHEDVPVIPGTSWAGAFRERYTAMYGDAGEARTRSLFGYVDQNGGMNQSKKSRITFSESTLRGGEWKVYTRNAIDRFTGGTIDGALYTERTYYGGTTELVIRIDPYDGLSLDDCRPLVCVLADLHNGFLAVGGLTSVGRGLFRIADVTLTVNGVVQDGFATALLNPADGFADGALIAPDVDRAASIMSGKAGR